MQFTVEVAETTLPELLEMACSGKEIIISRGSFAVRLVPGRHTPVVRTFGRLKGRLVVGDEFFEPLGDADLAAWDQG